MLMKRSNLLDLFCISVIPWEKKTEQLQQQAIAVFPFLDYEVLITRHLLRIFEHKSFRPSPFCRHPLARFLEIYFTCIYLLRVGKVRDIGKEVEFNPELDHEISV